MMIDVEKLHEGIRKYNDGSHTQREMAKLLGVGRTTVTRHMQLMAKTEGFVYKEPGRVYHPSKKGQLEREAKRAMIKDLVVKGYSINKISEELRIKHDVVSNVVSEMISDGTISEAKAIITRKKGKMVTPEKNKKYRKPVPSTLEPGESVKCTGAVAKKCVYGADVAGNGWCRYQQITGHCRILICPTSACTVYSERSRTNPRLKGIGE